MAEKQAPARRPITLEQPVRGERWSSETLELSGIERLRRAVDGQLPDSPVMRLTGFRFTDVGPGTTTVSMPASAWWQTSIGTFTPGTLAFVADAAVSSPYLASLPAHSAMTTSQLLINFLRTPTTDSGVINGRGQLIHSSHSVGLAEAFLEDVQGRLLAHCTARSVAIPIEARGSRRPHQPEDAVTESGEPDPYLRAPDMAVEGRERWAAASGLERLHYLQSEDYRTPILQLLGLRLTDIAEGETTGGMLASKWLTNYGGTIYGGALTFLAEGLCTAAVLSTLPAGTACAPLDLKMNFVRPVRPHDGEKTARARVTHRGRTMALVQCDVGSEGKLVATASESVLLLAGRPMETPVNVADEAAPPSE